ncbi:MAG: right-handed parallel beta-helix repeat-containing protein [Deltaproteobacteria bacterium]|nr:right-handed parallel beta-helix repeat-containing protein [Deltaproteobacteria bacterium]
MRRWTGTILGLILVLGSGVWSCSSDDSSASSGAGGSNGHLFDSGAFSFPYDHDAGPTNSAPGTEIGSALISTGSIGSWDTQPHAFASTLYVRPPGQAYGTGDGSSWTNALAGLPAAFQRDTRYYLASGEYYDGPFTDRYFHHEFEEPLNGEQYIGLFKAVESDHGPGEGWDSSFAQGPARLGPLAILSGYLIIDGQQGLGGKGEDFGIEISSRDCANRRDSPLNFPWNSTATNVSLRHVNIQDCGHRTDPTNPSEDAIYTYTGGLTRFVLKSSFVHDAFRRLILIQLGKDILLEGNTLARAGLQHEAGTLSFRNSQDIAIRRNVLVDSYGTFIALQDISNVQLHGNVLRRTLQDWEVWAAIVLSGTFQGVTVYNNTFYNLAGLNVGVRADDAPASSLLVANNLWASCRAPQIMLNGTHSYNAFFDNYRDATLLDDQIAEDTKQVITADPFAAAASGDLRLSGPTEPGTTLAAPYDIDLAGQTRAADGVWDRGAYEYLK